MVTAFIVAGAVGLFKEILGQIVILAVLMPIVASMGGVAGNQTLILVIRGIATQKIQRPVHGEITKNARRGWSTHNRVPIAHILDGPRMSGRYVRRQEEQKKKTARPERIEFVAVG